MLTARNLLFGRSHSVIRRLSNESAKLPSTAEVVIAGGGVVGTSIAYHLQKLGWKDILILEQGQAGSGTSWHAAGLVGSLREDKERMHLCKYAQDLFEELEGKYGIGFRRCGSLLLSQTKDRELNVYKNAVKARESGIEVEIVSPKEIEKLNPYIRIDDLTNGLFMPNDGVVNPTDLIQAYLKEATKEGETKLKEGIRVTKVLNEGKRVTSIETNAGSVKCDYFINAAGLWARDLGKASTPTVEVPLHACQHFYIVTKPMDVAMEMPVTRDYDSHLYFREWSGGIMGGGFEPGSLHCFYEGIPEKFEFQLLEENWDHFGYLMKGILNRYPSIENAEIRTFLNGPESFTVDGIPYVGRSKEFENYYISAGMSSVGIVSSAGVGKMVSELMTYGESSLWSPYTFDVRRMPPGANNKYVCREAAKAGLSASYELHYPHTSQGIRNIRTSPLHQLLSDAGANWKKDSSNWEIPLYFRTSEQETGELGQTFGQPDWLSNVQSEVNSCNENIGLVDLTSDSIFEINFDGKLGAGRFINHFDNVLGHDETDGYCTETVLLDDNKGCLARVTMVKLSTNRLLLITKARMHNFLLSWLQDRNLEDVKIKDLSGQYVQLGLIGEKSKDLLQEIITNPQFQFSNKNRSKIVNIDDVKDVILIPGLKENPENSVRLLVPAESSEGLYLLLSSFGEKYNLQNVGHLCLESLRVQNYVADCPNEIKLQTEKDFLENMFAGTTHKTDHSLALLKIDLKDKNNWPWGGEPIVTEDENIIGHVTSIGYTSNDLSVHALAVLKTACDIPSTEISVRVGQDVYNVEVLKY